MALDFVTVDGLKRNHPAWRLLAAEHAPLLISFLDRVFIKPNIRGIEQLRLVSLLDDELFRIRESKGEDSYPRSAAEYLEDWAQDSKGWLRKYYPAGSDEAHFDLSSGAEKAISWVESLGARSFVGTESRLRVVFDILRELVEESGTDTEETIKDLRRQKTEIEERIARLKAGEVESMDETRARERFLHMAAVAREILSDFREVEQNFRDLDRNTRERIAAWEGSKGELLESILDRRGDISNSDQGRSFRAFMDFLMSAERQERLGFMLDAAFDIPAVRDLGPDESLRRVHFDWMEAGERTQRTVALLSRQLRRFLDNQVWMENRRIMELIRSIEAKALDLREDAPAGSVSELEAAACEIGLPMERPLYSPPLRSRLNSTVNQAGEEDFDAQLLFGQWAVDREALRAKISQALEGKDQISLANLVADNPLERGLSELVGYLSLAADDPNATFSDKDRERLNWIDSTLTRRGSDIPRVIFTKGKNENGQ